MNVLPGIGSQRARCEPSYLVLPKSLRSTPNSAEDTTSRQGGLGFLERGQNVRSHLDNRKSRALSGISGSFQSPKFSAMMAPLGDRLPADRAIGRCQLPNRL